VESRRDSGRTLVIASAALVVLAAAAALFLPTGSEVTTSVTEGADPATVELSERSTTLAGEIRDGEEEWFVALVLLAPVVVALAAVALDRTRLRRASRMGAAVLLSAFTLLALASVGLFFLPGAGAMLVAALVPDSRF
jgi:hypothetical protein